MLGWIYRLIVGSFSRCDHDYKIIKEGTRRSVKTDDVVCYVYVLQCKKCGELKNHRAN